MSERITRRQAAILSAFTGIALGPFRDLHEYAEEVMDRPVFTHEFSSAKFSAELKRASRSDLMAIVAVTTTEQEGEG